MSLRDLNMEAALSHKLDSFTSTFPANAPSRPRTSKDVLAQSGLSANTRVETLRGPVAARDLRAGDMVQVQGGGFAALRWVGYSRPGNSDGVPIRRTGKAGIGGSMVLMPDSLVLVRHRLNALLFGTEEVLCPARYLTDADMFVEDPTVSPVFVHLLFDSYELVKCGDDWVESMVPDMARIKRELPEIAEEIVNAQPRLSSEHGLASYVQNRPVLDEREASVLFN